MLMLEWDDEPGMPTFLLCLHGAQCWDFIERLRDNGYTGPFRIRHMRMIA